MNFYDVIKKRRSIREYTKKPIEPQKLERIIEAVNCAPSACNLQPYRFEIIFNEELKSAVSSCYKNDWIDSAAALAVVIGDYESCWKRPEGTPIVEIDVGIAMEHFVLAATAEGLDTCWICFYEQKKVNEVLNIQAPCSALAISPLGYGCGNPRPFQRKSKDELFKITR